MRVRTLFQRRGREGTGGQTSAIMDILSYLCLAQLKSRPSNYPRLWSSTVVESLMLKTAVAVGRKTPRIAQQDTLMSS